MKVPTLLMNTWLHREYQLVSHCQYLLIQPEYSHVWNALLKTMDKKKKNQGSIEWKQLFTIDWFGIRKWFKGPVYFHLNNLRWWQHVIPRVTGVHLESRPKYWFTNMHVMSMFEDPKGARSIKKQCWHVNVDMSIISLYLIGKNVLLIVLIVLHRKCNREPGHKYLHISFNACNRLSLRH